MPDPRRLLDDRGLALVGIVVLSAVLLLAGVTAINLARHEARGTNREIQKQQALMLADAGAQAALARLDEDRATAANSTSYTATVTGAALGRGTYDYAIAQDPAYATDPTRKRVTATGHVGSVDSVVRAHAKVEPLGSILEPTPTPLATITPGATATPGGPFPPPTATPGATPTSMPTPTPASTPVPSANACDSLLSSLTDDVNLVSAVSALSTIFDGEIYAGDDVKFWAHSTSAINGRGVVWARAAFHSEVTLLGAPSTLANAYLYRQGAYVDNAPIPIRPGFRFANGVGNRGQIVTVPQRRSPFPVDRRGIERIPGIHVVDGTTAPPFGTWNATTDTWEYKTLLDALVAPQNQHVAYYVKGNVDFGSVYLARGSNLTIVADGTIDLNEATLFNGAASIRVGSTITVASAYGQAALALGAVTNVAVGTEQSLHLIARDRLMVGWNVAAAYNTTTMGVEVMLNVSGNPGVGSNLGGVNTKMNVLAWSETDLAFVKVSSIDAAGTTRANVCAHGPASIGYGSGVGSSLRQYRPELQ